MKLLYIHTSTSTSRMANLQQVVHMCNAFAENGVNVVLTLFGESDCPRIEVESLVEEYGPIHFSVGTRKINFSPLLDPYLIPGAIKRTLKRENPDIIFLRTNLYLKACMLTGIPVVYESHNATLHERLRWLDRYSKRYIAKISQSELNFSLIAISETLKDFWIKQGVSKSRLLSCHDGYDCSMFAHSMAKSEARESLNYRKTGVIATYCGSLMKDRGILDVISLAEVFRSIHFVLVGGPDYMKAEYDQLVKEKELTNVEFVGRVPHRNVPAYLYASDILLAVWSKKVRTINWCSPLKVFEYMASGRAIIAQGFPTIKEVLVNEHNALIAEPDNVQDLKRCIQKLLDTQLMPELGENAKIDAISHFTWRNRAKKIIEFCHIRCEHPR